MITSEKFPKFGEIWEVHFPKNSEDRKEIRPCLVISDNFKNEFDDEVVIVPITTQDLEFIEKFEVLINNNIENGLNFPSKILFDSPRTLNRHLRLRKRLGKVNKEIIVKGINSWLTAFNTENWKEISN
ncbi:MAG: hypothetical protein AD073_000303 [Mycoplasmataceae bacterium]|nr:MAG: hypothetical protein AD073_000303 [Mycoplasmataceae bacterium]